MDTKPTVLRHACELEGTPVNGEPLREYYDHDAQRILAVPSEMRGLLSMTGKTTTDDWSDNDEEKD